VPSGWIVIKSGGVQRKRNRPPPCGVQVKESRFDLARQFLHVQAVYRSVALEAWPIPRRNEAAFQWPALWSSKVGSAIGAGQPGWRKAEALELATGWNSAWLGAGIKS